jgi:hypothetical protein
MRVVIAETSFSRVGGALCLDFTNTVTWHRDGLMNERWQRPDAFIAWSLHSGALSASDMRAFARGRRSVRSIDRARLLRAMHIRRTLHEVFSAVALNVKPPAPALAATNRFLRAAQRTYGLKVTGPA